MALNPFCQFHPYLHMIYNKLSLFEKTQAVTDTKNKCFKDRLFFAFPYLTTTLSETNVLCLHGPWTCTPSACYSPWMGYIVRIRRHKQERNTKVATRRENGKLQPDRSAKKPGLKQITAVLPREHLF